MILKSFRKSRSASRQRCFHIKITSTLVCMLHEYTEGKTTLWFSRLCVFAWCTMSGKTAGFLPGCRLSFGWVTAAVRLVSADRFLCMSALNVSGTIAQGAPLTSKDQYSYWHASQRRLRSDHITLRWFIFTHTDTWLWGRRCSWNSPLPSPICVSSLQTQFCLTASLI